MTATINDGEEIEPMHIMLTITEIMKLLPHRYPMLLVDRILEIDDGQAHRRPEERLRERAVLPGTLSRRAGHAGRADRRGDGAVRRDAVLRDMPDRDKKLFLFGGVDKARFRKPGRSRRSAASSNAIVLQRRSTSVKMHGKAKVDGQRGRRGRAVQRDDRQAGVMTMAEIDSTAIVSSRRAPRARRRRRRVRRHRPERHHRQPARVVGPFTRDRRADHDRRAQPASTATPRSAARRRISNIKGEHTELAIGNDNVFREFVTINRGTAGGGGITTIGSNNFFMAYAHVAHDCHVGSNTIFANNATLAGHVEIGDFATIGAFSAVHQFCRVGEHAFIGGGSICTQDVLPYAKTVGQPRQPTYGINTIGLERKGFSKETIEALQRAYRILVRSKLRARRGAARRSRASSGYYPEARYLVEFVRGVEAGHHPMTRASASSAPATSAGCTRAS